MKEECEACHNTGYIAEMQYIYATKDMAIDSGSPEIEGQQIPWGSESQPCTYCNTLIETEAMSHAGNGCDKCHSPNHVIGIEHPEIYDGVLYYYCQSWHCGHRWHRWPEGHELRDRAAPFIDLILALP
jgi:Zn finger protein HypA/HybF involved in hydrogenase expression